MGLRVLVGRGAPDVISSWGVTSQFFSAVGSILISVGVPSDVCGPDGVDGLELVLVADDHACLLGALVSWGADTP